MLYFDTSFLAPLILDEPTSERVEAFLCSLPAGELSISHWTRVEFSSLLAREVRMGGLRPEDAVAADEQFGQLVDSSFHVILPRAEDFETARRFIQNFATGLRAGDALHLAIARNHSAATLYTLDEGLLKAGRLLDVGVSRGITG